MIYYDSTIHDENYVVPLNNAWHHYLKTHGPDKVMQLPIVIRYEEWVTWLNETYKLNMNYEPGSSPVWTMRCEDKIWAMFVLKWG